MCTLPNISYGNIPGCYFTSILVGGFKTYQTFRQIPTMLQRQASALCMAVSAVLVAESTMSYALVPFSLISRNLSTEAMYGNGDLEHLPEKWKLHKQTKRVMAYMVSKQRHF